MLNQLSGVAGINPSGVSDFNKIIKPESYSFNKELQGEEMSINITDNLGNIDFNSIGNNDPELKADLQGLIEKNQSYDKEDFLRGSEITTGEVANKFSDILGNYINSVNQKSKEAEKAVETFVSGGNIDMHSVMIASEKAGLSMQLALQMKNKFIQAYQEISRIQV